MESLFTWSGRYFGYRDGDNLWTYTGKHAGRFYDDEVYSPRGRYLGELRNGKLITRRSKASKRRSGFRPQRNRMGRMKLMNHVGSVMISGHEDFPHIED